MVIESNFKYSRTGSFWYETISTTGDETDFPRPVYGHPGIVFRDSELPQEPIETPSERSARITAETEEFFGRCELRLRQPNPNISHIIKLAADCADYHRQVVGGELNPGFIAMADCVCIG